MAGCCDPSGYPGAFNRATAERSVRSFEKRGLDSTASPMVDVLREVGLSGTTLLEVGAGSGTALATMLDDGAVRAVGIDISPNYETVAREFLADRGHADAIEWHTGDFVALEDRVPPSDVVFLNRVVCCYPDMDRLVDAATRRSKSHLAVSYPRNRLLIRLGIRIINAWMRINRKSFRVFVHDPEAITQRLTESGFEPVETGKTLGWHWGVWRRTQGAVA